MRELTITGSDDPEVLKATLRLQERESLHVAVARSVFCICAALVASVAMVCC